MKIAYSAKAPMHALFAKTNFTSAGVSAKVVLNNLKGVLIATKMAVSSAKRTFTLRNIDKGLEGSMFAKNVLMTQDANLECVMKMGVFNAKKDTLWSAISA